MEITLLKDNELIKLINPTFQGSDWVIKINNDVGYVAGLRTTKNAKVNSPVLLTRFRGLFRKLDWSVKISKEFMWLNPEVDFWNPGTGKWVIVAYVPFEFMPGDHSWVQPSDTTLQIRIY